MFSITPNMCRYNNLWNAKNINNIEILMYITQKHQLYVTF